MRTDVGVAVGRRRLELQLVVGIEEARADQIDQALERDAGGVEERRHVRAAPATNGTPASSARRSRSAATARAAAARRRANSSGDMPSASATSASRGRSPRPSVRISSSRVTPEVRRGRRGPAASGWWYGSVSGWTACCSRVVGLARDVLRHGAQHVGRRLARVEGGAAAGDRRLEQLVDEIDVGQRGQRVLAGERQVGEVGPAAEQHVERLEPSELACDRGRACGLSMQPLLDCSRRSGELTLR